MAAMFMQDTRDKDARPTALEEVAEEMLNGLFCSYEPPTPAAAAPERGRPRFRKSKTQNDGIKPRRSRSGGILRQPSKVFKRGKSHDRTVRWRDVERRRKSQACDPCDAGNEAMNEVIAPCHQPQDTTAYFDDAVVPYGSKEGSKKNKRSSKSPSLPKTNTPSFDFDTGAARTTPKRREQPKERDPPGSTSSLQKRKNRPTGDISAAAPQDMMEVRPPKSPRQSKQPGTDQVLFDDEGQPISATKSPSHRPPVMNDEPLSPTGIEVPLCGGLAPALEECCPRRPVQTTTYERVYPSATTSNAADDDDNSLVDPVPSWDSDGGGKSIYEGDDDEWVEKVPARKSWYRRLPRPSTPFKNRFKSKDQQYNEERDTPSPRRSRSKSPMKRIFSRSPMRRGRSHDGYDSDGDIRTNPSSLGGWDSEVGEDEIEFERPSRGRASPRSSMMATLRRKKLDEVEKDRRDGSPLKSTRSKSPKRRWSFTPKGRKAIYGDERFQNAANPTTPRSQRRFSSSPNASTTISSDFRTMEEEELDRDWAERESYISRSRSADKGGRSPERLSAAAADREERESYISRSRSSEREQPPASRGRPGGRMERPRTRSSSVERAERESHIAQSRSAEDRHSFDATTTRGRNGSRIDAVDYDEQGYYEEEQGYYDDRNYDDGRDYQDQNYEDRASGYPEEASAFPNRRRKGFLPSISPRRRRGQSPPALTMRARSRSFDDAAKSSGRVYGQRDPTPRMRRRQSFDYDPPDSHQVATPRRRRSRNFDEPELEPEEPEPLDMEEEEPSDWEEPSCRSMASSPFSFEDAACRPELPVSPREPMVDEPRRNPSWLEREDSSPSLVSDEDREEEIEDSKPAKGNILRRFGRRAKVAAKNLSRKASRDKREETDEDIWVTLQPKEKESEKKNTVVWEKTPPRPPRSSSRSRSRRQRGWDDSRYAVDTSSHRSVDSHPSMSQLIERYQPV